MVNNFIGTISHFFAENKALSYLLLIGITVFGAVSFWAMPKQYNPEIVRPAFVVSFVYESATPEVTLDRVGYEFIEKLQVVPGVEDIYTKITDGSTVMGTVMFEVGYDKAQAKVDLLTQLQSHGYLASGAVSQVSISEINPETIPVMQFVFSSPKLTVSEVREQVLDLRELLLLVPNVSELDVVGGEGSVILVEVSPVAMQAHGVTLDMLQVALTSASFRVASGEVEGESGTVKLVLEAAATTVNELNEIPVGSRVKLGEVATVYEGARPDRSYTWYARKDIVPTEVVMLAVAKREGSSAPVVTEAVVEALDARLATTEFKDLTYEIVSDDGVVARKEINNLTINLVVSIAIVAVTLLLFLSARASLVVLITIPLTFLVVLGIGYVAGESINRITLFALILSLGLLVDAAIVVVDNIFTHIKEAHEHGRNTSIARVAAGAMREVGLGLTLSALTSVVVFIPMRYITGMMGPYMAPISFFAPLALLVSLVLAITLVPFIATHLLRGDEVNSKLATFFQNKLNYVTKKYVTLLHHIAYKQKIRTRVLKAAVWLFFVSLVLPATGMVHFQMLPKADRDHLYAYIDVPAGTSRDQTNDFAKDVTAVLLKHSEVQTVEAFVAGAPMVDFNGLFKGAPSRTERDQATLRIDLTSKNERDGSSTDIASELRELFAEELGVKASFVRLMEEPPGPPVAATFEAKLSAENNEVLEMLRTELQNLLKDTVGVVDEYTSADAPIEEVVYTLNREAVATYGATNEQVLAWYMLANQPTFVAEYVASPSSERTGLYLTLPNNYRNSPAGLESIPLTTQSGETVMGAVLSTEYRERTGALYLEHAKTIEYVTAEVEDRSIVYVMIEVLRAISRGELTSFSVTDWTLFDMTLETEDGKKASISWGGEWEMTLENFRDLGLAMSVAMLLVYGVLVAHYGSFKIPALILANVPLGLTGILFGFWAFDMYLTATALIGFIVLIGIIVNNTILFLEYVELSQLEGNTLAESLIAAGAVRLRPIMLTSLTTMLGTLTVGSDPVWSGLAWSIMFGLVVSTLLTLVVLPALLLQFANKDTAMVQPAEVK